MKKRLISLVSLLLCLCLFGSCDMLGESFLLLGGDGPILTPFSRMVYERPDYAALDGMIDEMTEGLTTGEGKRSEMKALLTDIVDAYYYDIYTMNNMAFLKYSLDMENEALRAEYYAIMAETERLGARLEELYYLCADSKFKADFEREIMGEGFFDAYRGDPVTYPPAFTVLLERESELLKSYSEAMSTISVDYEGKTYTGEMIDGIVDEALYEAVCRVYYEKYNALLGEIYVELVKVRQQIADFCGYESYAEYAFDYLYAREYGVADADAYLQGIRTYLTPMYKKVMADRSSDAIYEMTAMSPQQTKTVTETLVKAMSKDLGKIYEQMVKNELCTVEASDKMYYGSFQIYFNRYMTPYLFVNGVGQISDILTLVHEFGHFASAYRNYGSTGSNDEGEVASQGLELLSLRYLDTILGEADAKSLRRYELYSILSALNECAAYTAFENLVYADKTPTLEECNAYFKECADAYGIEELSRSGVGDDRYWVFVNHLIEYPYYMIGYSVSASVAIQLYRLGQEEGMDTYLDLIDRADRYDFFGNLKAVGLASPFDEGSAEAVASFFFREFS